MRFQCNPGASSADLGAIPDDLRSLLPIDYLEFVTKCNGGEGFIGEDYLILWRIEELEEFNRDYEVAEYLSGVVLFGSNGGGEAFGFRQLEHAMDIVRVPFVGMCDELCEKVAPSFSLFVSEIS